MSTRGRPPKPAEDKLKSYGIRIKEKFRNNALTYPMDHPKRKEARDKVEAVYKEPYTDNILKEEA